MAHTVTEGLSCDIEELLLLKGGQHSEDVVMDFYVRR